jgi:hypothetical protein
MLIYIYGSLLFGFIYSMGTLYFNVRTNEQFYNFLIAEDKFIITLKNGLFVATIFLLIFLITSLLMPLIIIEGLYKWTNKKEN